MTTQFACVSAVACGAFLVGMPSLPAHAGDVTSTRLSGASDWADINLWNHDPGVATYPNNGNKGHNYDVILPGNLVEIHEGIAIDNLDISFSTLLLDGNALTVTNLLEAKVSTIGEGTVTAKDILLTSTALDLTNLNATTQTCTVNSNARIEFIGPSTLKVTDTMTFTGDGDIVSSSPGTQFLDLDNATLEKIGGTSATDLTVTIDAGNFTIRNQASNSVLRVLDHAQIWGDLSVESFTNADVELRAQLTVNKINIVNIDEGEVRLAGPTTLNGTLTAAGTGRVVLNAFDGSASLKSGTIDCPSSTPFVIEQLSEVGESSTVTNMGHVIWTDGIIKGGGLKNMSTMVTAQSINGRTIDGALLENSGFFDQNHPIVCRANSAIQNNEDWEIADIVVEMGVDPDQTSFTSTGTVIAELGTTSVVQTPMHCSGNMILAGSITAIDSLTLQDLTIDSTTASQNGGQFIVDPGIGSDADCTLNGTITLKSENLTLDTLILKSGEITLTGTIKEQSFDINSGASAVLEEGAFLCGGTLDLTSGFEQAGGTVAGEMLTNAGAYTLRRGNILADGLTNTGVVNLMQEDPNDPPSEIFKIVNLDTVQQTDTTINLSEGFSSGLWICIGTCAINMLAKGGIDSFTNTSEFIAENGATNVRISFDNQGTALARNSDLNLEGTVAQYDSVNQKLTGGCWQVVQGGSISFGNAVLREFGLDTDVLLSAVEMGGMNLWEGLVASSGDTTVENGTDLDVTNNDDNGDFMLSDEGEFTTIDLILAPAGSPARFTANRITNRGQMTAANTAVIQANTALDLLDGGILTGDLGVIETPIVNNISGDIQPGYPADFDGIPGPVDTTGQLTITGDYDQQSTGMLTIELAGTVPGDSDQLIITGDATLDGALVIDAINGYEPTENDSFEILTAANVTGQFSSISAPGAVDVTYLADRVVINFTGPACEGDIDMSGGVDSADLLALLGAWGTCRGCAQDINNDGNVDLTDLLALLAGWGVCE